MVSFAVSGGWADGPASWARSSVTSPREVIAATWSARPATLSSVSTAATAIGGSSDMVSNWSLRNSWWGPKLAMPRRTTLVATALAP